MKTKQHYRGICDYDDKPNCYNLQVLGIRQTVHGIIDKKQWDALTDEQQESYWKQLEEQEVVG